MKLHQVHDNLMGNWKSRERETGTGTGTGICAKSREETTARSELVHKRLQECLRAHGDLVHELRSTTMDFEFHLPSGPVTQHPSLL